MRLLRADRRADLLLGAATFVAALTVRAVLLGSAAYGDEPLFWFGAAHPFATPDGMTDLAGTPFHPRGLFFERPAYFAALWLPAQAGFEAFRAVSAVLGALLAPAGYALVRSRFGRVAATSAGLAIAVLPDLATWGAFGLTDSLMTLWLAAAALARLHGRRGLAAGFVLAAVWTKETAFLAAPALLAVDAVAAWRAGELGIRPPRAGRAAPMLWPVALGLLPLGLAFLLGFPRPGVHEPGYAARLLDGLFVSPWLLPVLLLGLWLPRSRPLAAWGLAPGAALLAMHVVLGAGVQAWYQVPAQAFAVVGAVASAAAAWQAFAGAAGSSLRRVRTSIAGTLPAATVGVVLVAMVLLPGGAARDLLHPMQGETGPGLTARIDYEMDRDRDRVEALRALPRGEDVVTLGLEFPHHLHPLLEQAGHVWVLSWPTYSPGRFTAQDVAAAVENDATWTLVAKQGTPWQAALLETYGDCTAFENAGYVILQGSRCAGRAERLEAAAGGRPW